MTLKTMTASLAALVWAATAAQAAGAAESTEAPLASPAQTAQTANAVRVMRDKETGKLRAPTDAELKDMLASERTARQVRGQAEAAGPGAPLVMRQHSNGMRSAVLGPEYLVTVKARRAADGKLEMSHDNPAYEHGSSSTQRPTE